MNTMDFLNSGDRFCAVNGIRLITVEPGFAVAEMDITPERLNADAVVQGGAIFTLADLAFAGAANAVNDMSREKTVMMSSHVVIVRPGTGTKLRAEARELNRGRRTGLYEIKVFDDRGRLVAVVTSTGFNTGQKSV